MQEIILIPIYYTTSNHHLAYEIVFGVVDQARLTLLLRFLNSLYFSKCQCHILDVMLSKQPKFRNLAKVFFFLLCVSNDSHCDIPGFQKMEE